MERFFSRIDKLEQNDFSQLAEKVCSCYGLGRLENVDIIKIGYEDFNAIIWTSKGRFVVKVFNNDRTDQDAFDCVDRTHTARQNGLPIPLIYSNPDGELITMISLGHSRFRLAVIDYVEGENFHRLGQKPTVEELDAIVNMAYALSQIDYRPPYIYDKWGIPNFSKEFEEKRDYLSFKQLKLIKPIYSAFLEFNLDALPKAFVHGDITSTNIMRDCNGNLWLVDFSVSNYMARIIEIIVVCGDLALILHDKDTSEERIRYCFESWCRKVNATQIERDSFLFLFSVANAINIMNTAVEVSNGNNSDENVMHMNQGLWGLSLFKNDNSPAKYAI